MILKIIKYNDGETPRPADELILESKKFLITSAEDTPISPDFENWINDHDGKLPLWLVRLNAGESYLFDTAYLMNNNGKTIQKYG